MNITRSQMDNAVWNGYVNTPFETSIGELFSTDVGLRTALSWAVTLEDGPRNVAKELPLRAA